MNNITKSMLVVSALLLSACGSGSSDSDGNSGTGTLSASITDAAIDEVSEVNLRVTALSLRQQDANQADSVEIDLTNPDGSALEFNLLEYQQGETFPLFDDERVPAGVYSHARLILEAPAKSPVVCANQQARDGSHVVEIINDGPVPIFIPSGANTGVKLASPFRVPEDGEAEIVIDFDLRQALHRPVGQTCYFLRPAFRVEAVQNTGRIVGTVASSMLDGTNQNCSDDDPKTGNAVYVYRGLDQTPGDIDAVDDADDNQEADPLATAKVSLDDQTGEFEYVVSFLSPGDYTVAFTCQADLDRIPNPEGTDDEKEANDDIIFQDPQNAVVEARKTTIVPFPPE